MTNNTTIQEEEEYRQKLREEQEYREKLQHSAPSTKHTKKWYKRNGWIVTFLILFYPVGLFLMWKYAAWSKATKWVITAIFICLFLSGSVFNKTKPTPSTSKPKQEAISTPESVQQATSAPINTPTPKIVQKYNIVVTSQIVKKVNGKCRYFFDIRNKDTKPFEGSVGIALYRANDKSPLAGDVFSTNKAIQPELGTSVSTDAYTCPASVHGANGLTNFTYTVRKGNDVVNTGKGMISDKFEDVDAYGL